MTASMVLGLVDDVLISTAIGLSIVCVASLSLTTFVTSSPNILLLLWPSTVPTSLLYQQTSNC